jgi:cation diffusion facilitator family transporter
MQNRTAQRIALFVGIGLMALKFLAWWITNSNAILTDALESIINVVAASFGLYSIWLSAMPRDENHPYGHGKIEFISAGFEGALILLAGLSVMGKAGYNLLYPQPIGKLDLGLILTAVAGAINFGLGYYLQRLGRKQHSLILTASGAHLKSDAYSSVGLVAGLGLVMLTDLPILDNIMAIFFGGVILFTGFKLVRTSIAGIMDEADDHLIREMVQALQAERHRQWIDVHNFRVIKYGATLHIDCHMTLPWYFTTRQNFQEVKAFERLMMAHTERPVELFVHIDPCDPPENCRLCPVRDCPERKAPQEERLDWTLDNIKENQKHRI